MAKGNWVAFPHKNKSFDYAGDTLEKNWAKLHAGDQEPFPSPDRVAKLIKAAPKAARSKDADAIANDLADAWRAFHRGDFREANDIGDSLGAIGAAVANKATGIHAVYLIDDEKQKLKIFEQIAARAEAAAALLPKEPNTHYFRAFSIGRYSQLISITKALSQGLAGKVKDSLDTTLSLAPKHAEAHLAMALYHAEIVGKVGGMLASLTYGAKPAIAEDHLKTAIKLAPDAPIVHLEHGNALLLLYGEKKEDDAAAAYAKAAKLKPRDAMEALDAAHAKAQIE